MRFFVPADRGREKFMARKRLNKKVALIGSAILAIVIVILILAVLYQTRDPEKFIREGDAAIKAANKATDKDMKIQEYQRAERSYHKARTRANVDSLKIDILFKLVDTYIQMNMYTEADQWRYVLGCWDQIIRIDPQNAKARFGQLNYFYVMADSGINQVWQEVRDQASEFIEVAKDADLFMENISKWEVFGMPKIWADEQRLGTYLYLIKGRACFELARMGAVTDPDELFTQAIEDLKKVQEFEPDNVDAYWYLAQAAIAKGEILASRADLEGRDKAIEQAKALLEQAVKKVGNDPKTHINLLSLRLLLAQKIGREQIQELEPEFLSLVDKFPQSAEAFSTLSRFYSVLQLSHKYLDKATEAAIEAHKLDQNKVVYAMNVANLYYRKFSCYGQKSDIDKAIEIAENALTLPNAEQKGGPRNWANRINRASLYAFLAQCYIGQILEDNVVRTESETAVCLRDAEQAVHEIEQILGSGEEPQVVKWRGMLELAKGNRDLAIRKLYAAYEQLKASARTDAQLSYTLSRIFMNTSEVGAAMEFLVSALKENISQFKPEATLDYTDTLLKFNAWTAAIYNINTFEEVFGPNERSRILRVRAYIGARQFDEAEEELAKLRPDDPNTIELNLAMAEARMNQLRIAIGQKQVEESASTILGGEIMPGKEETGEPKASVQLMEKELDDYRRLTAELVLKLLPIEPNYVQLTTVNGLCEYYITHGQISEAKALVDRFLQYHPDNIAIKVFKQILSEPKPGEVSQQRRKEIQEHVIMNISDPALRAVSLGLFYRSNNELEKAATEFKKALKIKNPQKSTTVRSVFKRVEETNMHSIAADYLLDIAVRLKDWELAEQIVETAQSENLDRCQGQLFEARLAIAKEDYKDALAKLDECIKQRPIFSRAYMIRGNVNDKLGNEHASIEDIQKAVSLNPLDGTIAKVLAVTLYRHNQELGDNISPEQITETRIALDRAMLLNPNELQLLDFYADYISDTEPLRAIVIRQNIQKIKPGVRNAIHLGRLLTKLAFEETDARQRESFFNAAAASFEQAKEINPHDVELLHSYAEYYRARGMDAEAEKILQASEEQVLLWDHYIKSGQFEKAEDALGQLYKSDPQNESVVKGLLYIAERTRDVEAAKRYSEELLSLQDNVENHLVQIQTYLKVGLIKEAEYKLQGFKENHPDEPRAMLLEAWLLMRQGQLEKAMELINRILQSDQNNAIAWQLRGQINLLVANFDEAINDLKKSKLLSDEPDIRLSLARAYLQTGREDDAIVELKNIVDLPGVTIEARELLQRLYIRLGRKEELVKLYDDTLEKFPDNVSWYNLAGAFAIAESYFDKGEQLYKEAYLRKQQEHSGQDMESEELDMEYVTAFDGYLQALVLNAGTLNTSNWQPRKLDKVLEESSKHIDGPLAPIAFYRMAEAKLKLGDEKVAIEYCRKAVDKAEINDTLASDILLKMFLLLGPEEVSRYCTEKLVTNPDSLSANWTMFNLTNIKADYDEAVNYINRCIEIAGSDSVRGVNYTVKKVEVLTLAFEKTSDNNYLKQGIADYESLLAKMPNNINVLNNLAYMLAENNERLSDALRYIKKVVEASPNNPSFLDTYAYVLYKNGEFSQAAEFTASALQQYEQSGILAPAEVYEHLGLIKEKLGANEQALSAYKQAYEIGADKLSERVRERIKEAIERLSQ